MSINLLPPEIKLLFLRALAFAPKDGTSITPVVVEDYAAFRDKPLLKDSRTLQSIKEAVRRVHSLATVDKSFYQLYKASEERLVEEIVGAHAEDLKVALAVVGLLRELEREVNTITIDDEEAGGDGEASSEDLAAKWEAGTLTNPPFVPCLSESRVTAFLEGILDGSYRSTFSAAEICAAPDILRFLWDDREITEAEAFSDRSYFLYWVLLRFSVPRFRPSPSPPNPRLDSALRKLLRIKPDAEVGPDRADIPDEELQVRLEDCEFPGAYSENARVLSHLPNSIVLPMMFEAVGEEVTMERAERWMEKVYRVDFGGDWKYWDEEFPSQNVRRKLFDGGHGRPANF